MDFGAYLNIEDLEYIAKANNIDIPRVRGYRLMQYEELISKKEIQDTIDDCKIYVIKHLCQSYPFWSSNPEYYSLNRYTSSLQDRYLIKDHDKNYIAVNWDRIHGWKRKIAKFEIKKKIQQMQKQYDTWNKYVGRSDVLYIHSRIGGNNWKLFENKSDLLNSSWFLDRVDDWFDTTYCDFYAKIDPVTRL